MQGNKLYNYTKQSRYNRDIIPSTLLRNNPIVTSPGHLINRGIDDIGEKLIDFLPKMSEHFKVKGSVGMPDASARLLHYSLTEDNKFHTITLLAHDKTDKEKSSFRKFIKEELNPTLVDITTNLVQFVWERGTTNIMGIAEVISYFGAPRMCT